MSDWSKLLPPLDDIINDKLRCILKKWIDEGELYIDYQPKEVVDYMFIDAHKWLYFTGFGFIVLGVGIFWRTR